MLPVWLVMSAAIVAVSSTVFAQDARPPSGAAATFPNPTVPRTIATGLVLPDAVARSGVQTRVGMAWDCIQPHLAPHVFASAVNGSVVIKKGKGPSCGLPSMDVTHIYYTSKPGFKGPDKLYVMSLQTGGQVQRLMTVLVK
jgi:hypothetical protein